MNRVPRAEWGAKPPRSVTSLTPAVGTTVPYEGPRMGEFPHSSCATKVRGIQAFHMGPSRGWTDIAYTAIVCPHGYVYECRWVGVRTAANGTNDGNSSAYAVCLLLGEGDPIPDAALAALVDVIDFLDLHGGAGPGVNGHRDWKATACPGDPAYQLVPAIRAAIAKRRTAPQPPQENDVPAPTDVTAALPTPTGKGRWLLTYDGGVRTEGDAKFFGSVPGLPPEKRLGVGGFYVIEPFSGGYALTDTKGNTYRFKAA